MLQFNYQIYSTYEIVYSKIMVVLAVKYHENFFHRDTISVNCDNLKLSYPVTLSLIPRTPSLIASPVFAY